MGLKFPKPRPAALDRADRRKALKAADEAENKKVRARSGGQCDVVIERYAEPHDSDPFNRWCLTFSRCGRRATQVHHMIGGWGKRARGNSKLAEHKQYCCNTCHKEITGHVLKRVGGVTPLWTDHYRRAD